MIEKYYNFTQNLFRLIKQKPSYDYRFFYKKDNLKFEAIKIQDSSCPTVSFDDRNFEIMIPSIDGIILYDNCNPLFIFKFRIYEQEFFQEKLITEELINDWIEMPYSMFVLSHGRIDELVHNISVKSFIYIDRYIEVLENYMTKN